MNLKDAIVSYILSRETSGKMNRDEKTLKRLYASSTDRRKKINSLY